MNKIIHQSESEMGRFSFLWFCIRSLGTEYGWDFLKKVFIRHPFRFITKIMASRHFQSRNNDLHLQSVIENQIESPDVIGLGFCLKPIQPACPSGRFNHDCEYLDNTLLQKRAPESIHIPPACLDCIVRILGVSAIEKGTSVYIMTSARDILNDLFLSGREKLGLKSGIFILCRYSMIPFRIAMLMSGLNGIILPYEEGDCRGYKNWRRADKGLKDERTSLSMDFRARIEHAFQSTDGTGFEVVDLKKEFNIYFPVKKTNSSL